MLLKKLKEVKENNLCTRSGTCIAICPENAINLDEQNYPIVGPNCNDCGLCLAACPGWEVDFPQLSARVLGRIPGPGELEGISRDIYLASARNEEIRERGSGGGVVTQLLVYLLRKKEIDGAVVVDMDEKIPYRAKSVLAETQEELLRTIQSKYAVVPVNQTLVKLREKKGRFALVGLHCQVQ